MTPENNKGFMLNGKKILIKGAAWTDDIFRRNIPETDEIQVGYIQDMNLNAVRLENLSAVSGDFLQLLDRNGIMVIDESMIDNTTGTKMAGPYNYVGPNYWYMDTLYGGAFGFNTAAGIGAQLPVKESLQKMIPDDKLWPVNEYWNFHCAVDSGSVSNLNYLAEVITRKYGEATGLDDYLRKADLLNYEGTKAMFEAYRANIPEATGIIQWKLNAAWPSLYWQLYDYYLIPNAAYYGVRKANAPEQLVYNYKDRSVHYLSDRVRPVERKARIALYGGDSQLLQEANFEFRVENDGSKKIFQLDSIAENVFLKLELYNRKDRQIADNFYCLSKEKNEYDWDKTDWVNTPLKSYADFTSLSKLPAAELTTTTSMVVNNDGTVQVIVNVSNAGPVISLMTRFVLKDEMGEIVYPVQWEDNYISLLPGDHRALHCVLSQEQIVGKDVKVYVSAWNLEEKDIMVDVEENP